MPDKWQDWMLSPVDFQASSSGSHLASLSRGVRGRDSTGP